VLKKKLYKEEIENKAHQNVPGESKNVTYLYCKTLRGYQWK
jgi:hypothetical protein